MTKSKAVERITPTQEKSKGIAIKEDAVTSKGKDMKLPTTSGKGKGKIKLVMKWSSRRVAEQFCETLPYRPATQNAKRLKAKARRQ
ncbi:hypothetical protein H5410_045717 [Solanum commersonii]|uniref:Uncharacterized protein n=1 Tax=Solanum commersonii TaxID=4109 RepID=A0A9J5XAB8_SOLCO|nr:hypothetical protein H5410_045717 [Solanum commersonii]